MGTRARHPGLRNHNPVFSSPICLEEFVFLGSWRRRMILDVLLDKVLSLAYPVEEAAIHQYAGLIFATQHQHSSVQPTDGFGDLRNGFPGNRLNDSVIKIPSKSAQALVALDICRRGNKC